MKKIRYSPEAKNKILQMKSKMKVRYGRKKASAIIRKLVVNFLFKFHRLLMRWNLSLHS